MPALSCTWHTVAEWAVIVTENASIYANVVAQGGPAYTRVCSDGTVWVEETLALAIAAAQP